MRRLILPTSFLFVLAWMLAHHHFMYQGWYVAHQWMGFLGFVVLPFLSTGVILLAAHALGRFLTRDWMVAICLGLGMLAAVTWVFGLLQLLYAPFLALPTLLMAVYGVVKYSPRFMKRRRYYPNLSGIETNWDGNLYRACGSGVKIRPLWYQWSLEDKLLLFVLIWWVYRTALLAFNPSVGFDATHAHLWQIQNFIAQGGYVFHPHHTNIALVHSLTTLQKLCLVSDPGSTMQYVAAMLSAGFLFRLGERYHSRTAGLLASLIFLVIPAAYFVYSQWFAGIFVVMYMLAALWWIAMQDGAMIPDEWRYKRYVVTGLLLGFGCAAKITMLPFALIIIVLCGKSWWRVFLWMCLAAAPWYLVNAYYYGNPFFPHKEAWFSWVVWGASNCELKVYQVPGIIETWYKWSPLVFWSNNNPLAHKGEMTSAGPWLAALSLPLLFVRRWTKPVIVLAAMVVVMYGYWWGVEGIWHDRYMVPVFALHALLCAWGVAELTKGERR